MTHGSGRLMDAGFALKVGRLFKTPYGGHGVDFVDQLNYQFSGGLMIIFIGIIGVRQYVGKPIQCWVPQEFTKAWEEFAENFCWVSNTYFLLPTDNIPITKEESQNVRYITYYQWVAIVLAGQAMITWIPHLIWRVGSRRLPMLIKSAREAAIPDTDLRRKAVSCLVSTLEEQAESQSRFLRVKNVLGRCGVMPSSRLTTLFLFCRLLFIGNSVGQVYLMKRFLGTNSTYFGYDVISNLIQGIEWDQSGHFPRVTFCQIPIRKMGQSHNMGPSYTIQCVLPINHFVEKVYVFLWFWFVLLGCLTILSTIHWTFLILLPSQRVSFIKQYLRAMRLISNTEQRDCARFVNMNLGPDGIFILHVVSKLASDLIALDVATTLWKNYRQAKLTGTEDDINRLLETCNRGTSVV